MLLLIGDFQPVFAFFSEFVAEAVGAQIAEADLVLGEGFTKFGQGSRIIVGNSGYV